MGGGGIGNRQPIKQFKPSPRVGMASGNTGPGGNAGGGNLAQAAGTGVPIRPGTAVSSSNQGGAMGGPPQGFIKGGMTSSKGF